MIAAALHFLGGMLFMLALILIGGIVAKAWAEHRYMDGDL